MFFFVLIVFVLVIVLVIFILIVVFVLIIVLVIHKKFTPSFTIIVCRKRGVILLNFILLFLPELRGSLSDKLFKASRKIKWVFKAGYC